VMIIMCAVEFALGLALIATATPVATGLPATAVRVITAGFFLVASGTLYEVRQRRPDVGCGCFGELSDAPIGLRTIARAALLGASAVVSIGGAPLHRPASSSQAAAWLGLLAAEFAVVAALSPEVAAISVRLGYSEPCELRRLPVNRTISALRASSLWRRYASHVVLPPGPPADVWREGCWRFVVYNGVSEGRRVELVFAVYLQRRRPPIRVAVLDHATDEVLAIAV
jgi:hypothetical protein